MIQLVFKKGKRSIKYAESIKAHEDLTARRDSVALPTPRISQVHKQVCHMICSVMECNQIKVFGRPCVADSWVPVKSNNVAHVEARSSLVGLRGSGWGHVQQAAPLEVDIKWVSKSLSWLPPTAQ